MDIFNKKPIISYKKYQALNVPVGDCIDYMSGTSGLTEEKNYLRLKNDGITYELLTGATIKSNQRVILTDEEKIERFVNKEGLLVTRKGKAGLTRYLAPGKYVINDDAYILFLRDEKQYDLNLKWLSMQYKEEFLSFTSSSDNGTWNMTGFFEHTQIDIPYIEEQNYIVSLYEQIEKRIEIITNLEKNLLVY